MLNLNHLFNQLSTLRSDLSIFPVEVENTVFAFEKSTMNHPRFDYQNNGSYVDQFLLGNSNFRNTPTNMICEKIQRFLMWMLDFTDIQRQFGWTTREWRQLSSKDISLFYLVMFNYPNVIALSCLILWKQMSNEQIESRMMTGGLNGIPPLAFMNFLRIYMI